MPPPPEYLSASMGLIEGGAIITTFGDKTKISDNQGNKLSDYPEKKVKTLYSPADALMTAKDNPSKEVVFLGVGFETIAPLVVAIIDRAKEEKVNNFSCFSSHKVIPPALKALTADKESRVDGFLLPGYVSVVIGEKGYAGLDIRGVITGFEPTDILRGVKNILNQIYQGKKKLQMPIKGWSAPGAIF